MDAPAAYTLNPFAGHHPVASSPREVDAARRAAERSLEEFRYYLERYGERGRLFGQSDGAWLVTLCRGDQAFVRQQVLWLGRVLSSRGIPRWLLQRHLEHLHAELVRALPERAGHYAPLLDAADLLRALQREQIPAETAEALAADFSARADPAWVRRLPQFGRILVAAVTDEAAGIGRAVTSLEEWCADRARFPASWVTAVHATIAEARSQVRTRRG